MRKIGLCLSGGGARGAYQIGAIKALDELGIFQQITAYSGTSIGAANSVLLASTDIETCKQAWFDIPEDGLQKNESFLARLRTEGYRIVERGIYQMDEFEKLLRTHTNLSNWKKIEVYATISEGGDVDKSFSLLRSTFRHYVKKESKINYQCLNKLDTEAVIQAVIASCSIPIVFPAVIVDGKKYYDGGMFDNVPVEPLVEAGCEEIIIIHLHRVHFFRPEKHPNVVFHEIKHKGSLGGVLDFSKEHSEKIYQYGYDDAMKYFTELKKEDYNE